MKYFKSLALVLLFAVFFTAFLPKNEKKTSPNIVWITSEDNSKHYLKLFDENGVATPNIEKLAETGLTFTRAFSNTPVCSAARSTLISGYFGPRMASHYHRKIQMVPMPEKAEMFPAYLRKSGYYTTNNVKEDYNITKAANVWDESSRTASWRNRKEGQAFFHVVNIGISHEARLHFSKEQMETNKTKTDPSTVFVQPNHPQTDLFRYTNAFYRDKIVSMDEKVGQIVKELKDDNLLEDTFIFYYGDHGGVLAGSKGYLAETGLHVPLVVHIPKNYAHLVDAEAGSSTSGFVSFVDFGATVLNLAGIAIPDGMDGRPFLGENISSEDRNARNETYSYADRFDEKYDMVRAIRKGKYKYVRNYQPFNFDGLMNNYRYKQMAYQEWQELYLDGKLNSVQSYFFEPKQPEALYDVEADPYETINLARAAAYKEKLHELRGKLDDWLKGMPDLSFYPEHYLIEAAFRNPVAFGQKHKKDIEKYISVADLAIQPFEKAKKEIIRSLNASDPWERYWALQVACGFTRQAKSLKELIGKIAENDSELINKVRAAEFLGLIKADDPSKIMTQALYESESPAEALLMLNAITLMESHAYSYSFSIEKVKLSKPVIESLEVQRRLEFLLK